MNSIIGQTYRNWICIVNDDCSDPQVFSQIQTTIAKDKRFKIYRNNADLGFYHNFERCLARVPRNVAFVGLADRVIYGFPKS